MAYIAQLPEEEQNKFGSTAPTTPYPAAPQGGGSAGSAASGTNAAPGMGTSTQFGSNAAKLSDYLSANKDNAAGFGNQVASDLTKGYDQTKGQIDAGFNNFNQQVNQGYTPANPDLVNRAASNPADFVKNSGDVDSFKSIYRDQYTGPQNFESSAPYTDINANVNKAVENSSLVNSPSGLSTYLTNSGYESNATPGMKTLDTALLSGSKDAQNAIKSAAAPYSGLNDYLSQRTNAANQAAGNAQTQAPQIAQQAQDQFTGSSGVIPTFQNQFNANLTNARTTGTQTANRNVEDFLAGTATPDEMRSLGIEPNLFKDVKGNLDYLKNDYGQNTDLNSYLNRIDPNAALTSSNFATTDDYAKSAALAQLTGQDLSGFLNPADIAKAGTAPTQFANVDMQRLGLDAMDGLKQQDAQFMQAHPAPSLDAKDKTTQIDLVRRNPEILKNPNWAIWAKENVPTAIEIGPTPPPTFSRNPNGKVYRAN